MKKSSPVDYVAHIKLDSKDLEKKLVRIKKLLLEVKILSKEVNELLGFIND